MNKIPQPLLKKICQIGLALYTICLLLLTLIPFRYRVPERHHFPWPIGPSQLEGFDVWNNVVLFIPFGLLLHFVLPKKTRYHSVWKALLIGGSISFTVETLQIIIPARFSSFSDLFANTLGAGIGAWMGIFFENKNLLSYLLPYRQKIILASFFLYAAILFSLPLISLDPIVEWQKGARILIGNNVEQERAWKGDLLSAAIYDHVLSDGQIQQHFQSGPSLMAHPEMPILLYLFDGQAALQDHSLLLPPLHLESFGPPHKITKGRGIHFTGDTFLISKEEGKKVYDRINATRQFAMEVWFYPSRQSDQGGRIISFANHRRDLFYLRQSRDEMAFSIEGNPFRKGHVNWEKVEKIFEKSNGPVHIVSLYHAGELLIYYNGKKVAEGQMGNGFFLLASRLNFDRMAIGGASLVAILLFSPLGFLFAILSQNRSFLHSLIKAALGVLFVCFILFLQAQQTPLFFGPWSVGVPPMAFLLGFIFGEKIKKSLAQPIPA